MLLLYPVYKFGHCSFPLVVTDSVRAFVDEC